VNKDKESADRLKQMFIETCHPFGPAAPEALVNLATGKSVCEATAKYLTTTLHRGKLARSEFLLECAEDGSRFLKAVKRTRVQNFASENARKPIKCDKVGTKGVRDAFAHVLAMDAVREVIDLRDLLSHPITSIPLSIAHSDGSVTKTTKSVLTKVLEGKQKEPLLDISLSVRPSVYLVDGGLILYEVLPRHKQSTYRSIVRDIMVHIYRSAGIAMEVHLLLDKYVTPSIKDPERRNRGGGCDEDFVITGL